MYGSNHSKGVLRSIPRFAPFTVTDQIQSHWIRQWCQANIDKKEHGGVVLGDRVILPDENSSDELVDWETLAISEEVGEPHSFERKSCEISLGWLATKDLRYIGEWHTHLMDDHHSPEDYGFFAQPGLGLSNAYSFLISEFGFRMACVGWDNRFNGQGPRVVESSMIKWNRGTIVCRNTVFTEWELPPSVVNSKTGLLVPMHELGGEFEDRY